MSAAATIRRLLEHGDLTFRDFMEVALYDPTSGYYAQERSPVGRGGDYLTSPATSAAFASALAGFAREFLDRAGRPSTIADVGCGDGALIRAIAAAVESSESVRFFGVDRSLSRIDGTEGTVQWIRTVDELPKDGAHLLISNELFDAIPFARLVQRDEHLHELCVTEGESGFDWSEREATAEYDDYFAARNIELADGQFADISPEWERTYEDLCRVVEHGLIVTFDYGYPADRLFSGRARRYGTAVAYSQHQAHRDLLANPGLQDLTAHINFSDLIRAGERAGFETLFFDRQAIFLLSIGIAAHPLFQPVTGVAVSGVEEAIELFGQRDDARRLILPDGVGTDVRVLVQGKGIATSGWSFQQRPF